MDISGFILQLSYLAPAILFALTVHEASHALVAYWRGDPTAKLAGRMSLNPIRHLDLMGTIVFFVTALAGAGIGWAKPVPVDARYLKDPRRDGMLIAASGPVSNFITAAVLSIVLRILLATGALSSDAAWATWLAFVLVAGVRINIILACFNLIPIPPLDGSGVVMGLLPRKAAIKYYQVGRYGMLIILALIILPGWLPGFPDLLIPLVVTPAHWLVKFLLPMVW